MSLFDLFRRFFEPVGRRDPFFGGMTQDDDDDEDDDYDEDENVGNPFDRVPAHNFGFSFGPGATRFHDAFGFQEFFRDFNELFADFGAITVRVPELPGIEPPSPVPEGATLRSPRDSMLKYPDSYLPREHSQDRPRLPGTTPWGKFHWQEDHAGSISQSNVRQDKDLDAEVSSRGLDTILRPSEPKPSSYFQSVSVSRVTRPDGTVEERRSVRDSQGHTTSTVTLKRGEQILSSTTQDPPEGTRDGDRTGATQGKIGSPVMDLSDSETVLNRILQRFFSQR